MFILSVCLLANLWISKCAENISNAIDVSTHHPTKIPKHRPSKAPTKKPTKHPTKKPTKAKVPSSVPSVSKYPSSLRCAFPHCLPSSPTSNPTKRIEYPNGLILSNSTILSYSNTYIAFGGTVSITDYAELIITDSTIALDMSGGPNSAIVAIFGNGALKLNNVNLVQYVNSSYVCQISNWGFHDNSYVHFTNVYRGCNWMVIFNNSSYYSTGGHSGLTIDPAFHGSIAILHETYVWFELYLLAGYYTLSNIPQKDDVVTSSTSPFFQGLLRGGTWRGSALNIVGCTIHEVDLGISNHVHLTVVNMRSFSFAWSLGFGPHDEGYKKNQTVRGLEKGYYFSAAWKIGNSSIALLNSTVLIWWGAYWWDTQIVFESCTLDDVAVSNNAIIWMVNGTFTSLSLYDKSHATISHFYPSSKLPRSSIKVTDNAELRVISSPEISGDSIVVTGNGKVILGNNLLISNSILSPVELPDDISNATNAYTGVSSIIWPTILRPVPANE